MKSFQILLNPRFTAGTQSINSELVLDNSYYSYIIRNGGGLVNEFNVRAYLNDDRNIQITRDFFAYLTGNTTTPEVLNILRSDKKLSSIFNDYYQRNILTGSNVANTAIIAQNLTGTNVVTEMTYLHPWFGYAPSKQLTGITKSIYNATPAVQYKQVNSEFTTEESYYIPVYLERGTNQMALGKVHYDQIIDKLLSGSTIVSLPTTGSTITTGITPTTGVTTGVTPSPSL